MKSSAHQVTKLLEQWSSGDEAALEQLMPLVHDELHRLAHQHMRREPGSYSANLSAYQRGVSSSGGSAADQIRESRALFWYRGKIDAADSRARRAPPSGCETRWQYDSSAAG